MDYQQVKQGMVKRFGIGIVLAAIACGALFVTEVATDGFRHDFGPHWLVPMLIGFVIALSLATILICVTVLRQLLRLQSTAHP